MKDWPETISLIEWFLYGVTELKGNPKTISPALARILAHHVSSFNATKCTAGTSVTPEFDQVRFGKYFVRSRISFLIYLPTRSPTRDSFRHFLALDAAYVDNAISQKLSMRMVSFGGTIHPQKQKNQGCDTCRNLDHKRARGIPHGVNGVDALELSAELNRISSPFKFVPHS